MEHKVFFRVHTMVTDPEAKSHLSFDFKNIDLAAAFDGCDISRVWIEILENEVDTVNSPMWRE